MRITRRSVAIALLALLIVAAGCSGGAGTGQEVAATNAEFDAAASGGGDAGEPRATRAAEATPAPEEKGAPAGRDVQARARIKTGHVELEVDDFDAARRNLTRAVERYGGFVSDSRQRLHRVDNETYTTGVIRLRVPKENFTALMNRIQEEGTVLSIEQNTRDVTEQLIDINARLENLRAQREQLRDLYQRANDTEEILQIQDRLTEVQTEIERLEARKQALKRQVALSTITVELREPRPDPDRIGPDAWYEIGVVAAFLESISGVIIVLRALVVAVAYAIPYLLVFGIPLVAAGFGIRRYRRSSRSGDEDGGEGAEAADGNGGDGEER